MGTGVTPVLLVCTGVVCVGGLAGEVGVAGVGVVGVVLLDPFAAVADGEAGKEAGAGGFDFAVDLYPC